MAKKWYSFFVVTDEQAKGGSAASPSPDAPSRAGDLAPPDPATASALAAADSLPVDLAAVYDAAKIVPAAHGYTVLKVAEMLQSEHLATLPIDVKRKSIMVALDAAGVTVSEIVEDAVRRDRALDTCEQVLQARLDDLRGRAAADNRHIEDEINRRVTELRAKMAENDKAVATEQQELQAWLARKRQEEARIAEAVSHFVSENPITTTGTAKD